MSNNKYFDEEVIEMVNEAESSFADNALPADDLPRDEQTIYTGIKILGEWIAFEERRFIEEKISMTVPAEYKPMDEETAQIKYPMEQRPGVILTDHTGASNISINHMDQAISADELEKFRDKMASMMNRMNPGIKAQATGTEEISGNKAVYVEFTNPALDMKLYNLMFFMELDGRVLMININFPAKSMKYWKDPAFEMMRSVKIKKGQTEDE